MNHIEAAADRLLPDLDGGAIRPLDMAVGTSPVLAVVVETPAAATFILTTYDEVYGSWFPRSARVAVTPRGMGVRQLLEARQRRSLIPA